MVYKIEDISIPQFEFRGQPLSDQNSKFFLNCIINKIHEISLIEDKELGEQFLVKVFLKRIKAYDLKFNISNFFFVMSLVTFVDTPANAMILLRLCWQYWKRTRKEFLNIEDWAFIFPMGTPTQLELKKMWESQKRKDEPIGENMIDNIKYWK